LPLLSIKDGKFKKLIKDRQTDSQKRCTFSKFPFFLLKPFISVDLTHLLTVLGQGETESQTWGDFFSSYLGG
jgi:hypothetical protein